MKIRACIHTRRSHRFPLVSVSLVYNVVEFSTLVFSKRGTALSAQLRVADSKPLAFSQTVPTSVRRSNA